MSVHNIYIFKPLKKSIHLLLLICLLYDPCFAQNKFTISGFIKDEKGEELIGASIYIDSLNAGTITNAYGFYSITLPENLYKVSYSYMGYQNITRSINLDKNITVNIDLEPASQDITEVEITSQNKNDNIQSVGMGMIKLQSKTIKNIPVLLGETDILKAIQMLPGVQAKGEGLSGFSVRGGNSDQNLILLDEAPVYNASHLMGFFSIFNHDAIKDVKLYKGDIPAEFGGRLSSLLDIRTKDGNQKQLSASGGIGTISSRLTVESPLFKDKASILISGRRSYADIFLPLSNNEEIKNNKLYFYDLNLKLKININDKNRLYFSGYLGRDAFKYSGIYFMSWGNTTETFRWNHLFSDKLFSNLSLIHSKYDYDLGKSSELTGVTWKSSLEDYSLKYDFTFYPNPANTIKFGILNSYHNFDPGNAKGTNPNSIYNELKLPKSYAVENAVYFSNEHKINPVLAIEYGLRYSLFLNIGKGTIYNFDDNYNVLDSTIYPSGEIYKKHSGFEPRIGLRYSIGEFSSLKANYSRTRQYLHLASNSAAGSPLDLWIPSSPNIKPQYADQVAFGYFQNLSNNSFEISIETYYKKMNNQIDFRDHADVLLNPALEGEFRAGVAWSYGIEFLIRKQEGKLTGWVSYTLSKTDKKIAEINNGDTYPAIYDRRHDISIITNYKVNNRISFSINWVYASGAPATFPTGRYEYGRAIIPIYTKRNSYRLPAYHRLDLSLSLKGKERPGKKMHSDWVFSVYNAYFRKNTWMIFFNQNEENPLVTEARKLYLFPIIPAISYNFVF